MVDMSSGPRRRMLPSTLLLAAALVVFLPSPLFAEISDGAHGGNEHFFFLPPLVPRPSPTGIFAGSLTPVVQICEWRATGCVFPLVAEFTTDTGSGSDRVRVSFEDEHYIVNWKPRRGLDPKKTYRIRVLFRTQEKIPIEKEIGHADVTVSNRTIPIKFRIEQGVFPIGELAPGERAKISPVLLKKLISPPVTEPIEALVNVVDDGIPLPALTGVEILKDFRPTLAKLFVRITDSTALASLAQSDNVKYVYENRRWVLVTEPWQETIGQSLAQQSGYIGTGAAVAILDDGGRGLGAAGRLPDRRVIDLSVPAFGGCTDVGTPASCRVVADVNPYWADPHIDNHATYVARRVALTAPGADIIAYDAVFNSVVDGSTFSEALKWILDHRAEYNVVAVNMSFGSDADGSEPAGPYSTEDCPKGDDDDFQRLRGAGIMPIAAAGNDGAWQRSRGIFGGISHPACSPFVVSVGGSTNETDVIWDNSTRGPNLDLLAPALQSDGGPGTSIAAPTVAGAWAVLRVARPNLSLEETLELLKTTGVPIHDPESGLTFPRIQLAAALQAAGAALVVYDNGASTHSGGVAVGHFIAADDFVLDVATDVSGASVDLHDRPADQNGRWDGTVEWWLFRDNAGVPGSLIASGTGKNIKQRDIVEDALGFRDFTVDFDFGDAGEVIPLAAGETFWLGLHMQADFSRVSVFWDHQGSTVGYPARKGGEVIGGSPNFVDGQFAGPSAFDTAFRVRGAPTR